MVLSLNRYNLIFLNLFLYALIFLQYVSFGNSLANESHLYLLEIELIVIYFIGLASSIRISGLMSVYTLFLLSSLLFNYSRFFLDILTNFNINQGDLFSDYFISNEVWIKLLYVVIIFLVVCNLAFLLFYKKQKLLLKSKPLYIDIGEKIILTLTIPLLVLGILHLRYVFQIGYLSIFNGEAANFKYFSLYYLLSRIFMFGYMLLLAGIPSEKKFRRITLIVILISFIEALKGQRGHFLLIIIYALWYFQNIYQKKIKLTKLISFAAIVLIGSELLLSLRNNTVFAISNALNIPYEFLRLNGISILIPAYMINFEDTFVNTSTPYFFTPLYDYLYRLFIDSSVFYEGRTLTLLKTSNYLSNQLIYYINPSAYFAGMGTGSAYIAEFYDLGGVFIGGILLFILVSIIMKWESKFYSKRDVTFLSMIVIPQFIYMPRDSFLKIIFDLVSIYAFYSILKLFTRLKINKT